MAMCLYPEAQKKAQAELDNVLGGRLPEFNDRPNLPYINAMVKESMRWQLVLPLGVVHMCTNGDEYDGYYIPKGTIVIGNAWTILHDSEVFENPYTYNPDRYLKDGKIDPTVRDPSVASFGFGRRICPGRFFSDNSLFSIIAHVLAVYDIRPGLDNNGKEIEIKPEMTGGSLSYPERFACRITPRSKEAEDLINNSGLLMD
ncbi:cytochrome P450 [Macrolepiota fuliginosa MF-IS2]|uniref:Cytochrome P450 n=1 Tax=Macrolepiota fuliginosa MF-IS2 TaxID=1400762 RepID=A0A9P6BYD2_9AGAR|nr:cytochrome P450 [Macrolepiota fuliginosa MF-IS2]